MPFTAGARAPALILGFRLAPDVQSVFSAVGKGAGVKLRVPFLELGAGARGG